MKSEKLLLFNLYQGKAEDAAEGQPDPERHGGRAPAALVQQDQQKGLFQRAVIVILVK